MSLCSPAPSSATRSIWPVRRLGPGPVPWLPTTSNSWTGWCGWTARRSSSFTLPRWARFSSTDLVLSGRSVQPATLCRSGIPLPVAWPWAGEWLLGFDLGSFTVENLLCGLGLEMGLACRVPGDSRWIASSAGAMIARPLSAGACPRYTHRGSTPLPGLCRVELRQGTLAVVVWREQRRAWNISYRRT
jgi:hypothetical protein